MRTVHLISLKHICFHHDRYIYNLHNPNPNNPDLVFTHNLCSYHTILWVVTCLREYTDHTAEFRSEGEGSNKLLLCYQQPHELTTKDTIVRWLKTVLLWAGMTSFTPHSFRGASSSAMFKLGVVVPDILKVAGGSKVYTFKRFCNKHIWSKDIPNTILNYYAKVGT